MTSSVTHLLDVPFEERQSASWAGARWDATLRCWTWVGDDPLPAKLNKYAAQPGSWEWWQQCNLNGDAGFITAAPDAKTPVLRPHQREAVEKLRDAWTAGLPGFLLADEVGLGKTYSVLLGVEEMFENLNVLVLAPLSVVAHWRLSLLQTGSRNRWCVTNYERAKKLLVEPESSKTAVKTRTKNKRHSSQGTSKVEWDIVICDEAHRLKNPVAQRSAAVRQLTSTAPRARRWLPDGSFVIWMSATAGQNPLELAYAAQLLSATSGRPVRKLDEFDQWCRQMGIAVKKGAYGAWGWERNDADLETMNKLLFESSPPCALRRRPTDIAGWPSLVRQPFPVELNAHEMTLYEEAWEDFCVSVLESKKKGKPSSSNALVAALRFRQKASLLRVEHSVRHVAELVESGLQVAVSAAFIESADALRSGLEKKRIKVASFDGRTSAAERQDERLRFQQDAAQVIIFTVTEGISLHACEEAVQGSATSRALVVHDLRWSALEIAQIEGRCHRDGQNAVAYHMFASATVEAKVASAVAARLEDMATMLGDDTTGIDALTSAANDALALTS